tara:strand:+ start:493 stop:1629 length:1137 start_codon:yes stop_codon:yes gene_type:complete
VSNERSAEFVIIGAGLAGAAIADRLAQAGHRDLLIIEQEDQPAQHGSGQNAGMLRQHASNPYTSALARRGLDLHRTLHQRVENITPFHPTGSLLVGGSGPELSAGYRAGTTQRINEDIFRRKTKLNLPNGARALFCAGDGLRDAQSLCHQLINGSGATLQFSCRVEGIETSNGQVSGVKLEHGQRVRTDHVIVCGGAWSREFLDLPLQAFRRHLYLFDVDNQRPDMPWTWDLDGELYFRGHDAGLLVSACDETPDQATRGNQPGEDAEVLSMLHRCLEERWPQLKSSRLMKSWAGLRVLSPDDAFILGPDPRLDGLAWCTGLGGHGLTCALSAAALALRPWLGDGTGLGEDPRGPDLDTLQQAHGIDRLPFLKEIWDA